MTTSKIAHPFEVITSSQNTKFKFWQSLVDSKGIKKNNLALLSGEKLIQEYLKLGLPVESEILPPHGKSLLPAGSRKSFELKADLFNAIDINGTHFPILVIPVPEFEKSSFGNPQEIEVIAPLQDPRNMGAVIRSCAAFGVRKIHLPPTACHPYHPKCLKVAAGGILNLSFSRCPSLTDQFAHETGLQKNQLYFLDSQGKSIRDFKPNNAFYLAVGEEGHGLPQSFRNDSQALSIPIKNIESLNAAVAVSIALYALTSF